MVIESDYGKFIVNRRCAFQRHGALAAIVAGGIIAGTVDIGAASLISTASPVRILQFVAGGVLGRAALQSGAAMALLGMALQWAMSLVIAAVYVCACPRWALSSRWWIAGGLSYGVVVFVVMNYVVVPLSAWDKFPVFTAAQFAENMLAMWAFGLIVAYAAYRFVRVR